MTHNQNHDHARSDRPHSLPVRFEFTDPEAVSIYIAGTFNNWQPDAKPMHPVGNSRWVKETLLPPGTDEYCLVVDGRSLPIFADVCWTHRARRRLIHQIPVG